MPTVVITHASTGHSRYFTVEDLARLRAAAEVRVLGDLDEPAQADALATADIILSSWGMPKRDAAFLAKTPRLRAVCYAAGSVKGFVTPESYARGVLVTTAMHANAVPVAEVTVALIILANKGWFQSLFAMRAAGARVAAPAHPGNYRTHVGLISFGAIAARPTSSNSPATARWSACTHRTSRRRGTCSRPPSSAPCRMVRCSSTRPAAP